MKNLLVQYSTVASKNMDPFKWQAAGMGYIIRSQMGRFIVIDGGHPVDALGLIETLESLCEGVPVIDLWIITHPHRDHYGALLGVSLDEKLKKRIKLNHVFAALPDESFVDAGRNIAYKDEILVVKNAAYSLGVDIIHPKKNDIFYTDDLFTEVLLTVDDLISPASDPNETSIIFKIHAANQSILFLGDTYSKPSKQLADEMGEKLQSDFCQLAHHALNGGHTALYEYVKPKIALVPMTRPAFDAMTIGEYKDEGGTRHNRFVLLGMADECMWISADGTKVVELPFDFS